MTVLELRDLLDYLEMEGKGNAIVTDKFCNEINNFSILEDTTIVIDNKEYEIVKLFET